MGTINTKKESRTKAERHLNWMGGAGYFVSNPVATLRMVAASCFFGEPTYYHVDEEQGERPKKPPAGPPLSKTDREHLRDTLHALDPREWRGMTPAALMESAIDAAIDHDPKATLELAVELRDAHNIRTTPQVILVRAANHAKVKGTGLVRRYAREICARGDEPSVGLAYQLARYGAGAPIPNALKKAWALALESLSEYELAKYRMEDRKVKTVDVANLVHPRSEAVGKLCKGQLSAAGRTWEAIISAEGSSEASWRKALEVMGHMALLRNLRNLHNAGIETSVFADKLKSGVKNGKQLPFRYFSAYRALAPAGVPGPLLDLVEECMSIAVDGLPKFPGRTMFLCDNSGSAWGTTTSSMGTMHIAEIANITGVIGGQACDEAYLGVFGDRLNVTSVRRRASIFHQVEQANEHGHRIGGSTENGIWLFWNRAIRANEHWDNVFVMSDMQAGHGGLYGERPSEYSEFAWSDGHHIDVSKLVNAYRVRVNPKVNVFLVQVAGYKGTILPEFYERTYILGGWSDGLLRFAAAMAEMDSKAPTQ